MGPYFIDTQYFFLSVKDFTILLVNKIFFGQFISNTQLANKSGFTKETTINYLFKHLLLCIKISLVKIGHEIF